MTIDGGDEMLDCGKVYGFLEGCDGKRARLTTERGATLTGLVTVGKVGVHTDVRFDGYGGLVYGRTWVKVETMGDKGRYVDVTSEVA